MNTTDHYILDLGGEHPRPVPCPDLRAWADWMKRHNADRMVAYTALGDGLYVVSTVFLGIDHDFTGEGPPLLYETMIFTHEPGDQMSTAWDEQWRYSTRAEALEGHAHAVDYAQRTVSGQQVEEAPVHVVELLRRAFDLPRP